MAEYQRIEYRISKDGQIIETVLDGTGTGCVEMTSAIEAALGRVETQELLPSYYQDHDIDPETTQTIHQG
ncbi:MAG: DUF2997 domain-containing protein [Cyanobacteria bacterium]|nr:DUF2997 domain-containing protein [Cyanobacteriota bacterium]MDW8201273.1 DUF2997 domain-containing protein [Cyanobacteriota bacterium SKYGB_h_bin112]